MSRPGARLWERLLEAPRGALDLLLPPLCGACGDAGLVAHGLCEPCGRMLLERVCLGYCPRCGSSLGPNVPPREDGCSACPPTLPRVARVIRLGPYAPPLRGAIQQIKYRKREGLRKYLGRLLGEAVGARITDRPFDVVVPVPMHWLRRLTRGYDHASLLAAEVAATLGLPMAHELTRVRDTPPQARLSRTGRLENVRHAFAARDARSLQGAVVLLVDDVTTTGATAGEAARTLLSAGASSVTLAVLAKAEAPRAYAGGV